MTKTFIDKLAYISIKDKKLLCTLTKGKDVFYIPGGKREGNETDQEALIREVQEELSVDLIPETIKKYGVYEAQAHGKPEGTVVRMTCYTGDLKANSEIEKLVWFEHKDKLKTSLVDHAIFDDLKAQGLID